MASSTPNSYGLPQAPNSSTTSAAAGNIYYGDYNHIAHAAGKSPSQLIEVGLHQQQPQSQLPQQHVNQVGPFEKRVVYHSSSSLGNYDSYISGMSSDSELTTTTASARHHHHRPYSSQSRVYHAHPVPRNTTAASSRLSHYSSNSAVNAQTIPQSSTYTIRATDQQQQQQQPQQQLINQGALTMTPPSLPMSSISHQNSVASSGSMSSSYLPAMLPVDSPVSPVLVQQAMRQKTGSGRQLPQRPFKQSMSIDHHSLTNQYTGISGQHTTASTHSPAHQSAMGLHRNITGDQLGAYQHQDSYPSISGGHQRFESTTSGQYNESPSQRSIRLEMEMMEKQAANMNLYDAGERSMADLPPTGPIRSSSSTSRHVPTNINPNQGLLEHQQQLHHSAEPYHQHSQDQYSGSSYSQQQKIPSTASTDWLPPMGNTNRPGGQFKQAMSIDHYSAARQQQQHLQRHFSPARQNQFASTDQYHSLGSYMGSSPNHALMSNTPNYEPTSCSQLTSDYYSPGGQDHAMVKYHNQYQAQQHPKPSSSTSSTHHQPVGASSLEQHGVKLYEKSDLVSGSRSSNVQQQHPNGQPNLQHQPSSSSSNSNLSGSLKSSNIENMTNLEKQTSNSEHQKSVSSASTSSHYQQSPQHKMHSSGHYVGRQELLRRGYTSVTAPSTSYVGDFGGSQSALSESGDLSISQTSHSGPSTKRVSSERATGIIITMSFSLCSR